VRRGAVDLLPPDLRGDAIPTRLRYVLLGAYPGTDDPRLAAYGLLGAGRSPQENQERLAALLPRVTAAVAAGEVALPIDLSPDVLAAPASPPTRRTPARAPIPPRLPPRRPRLSESPPAARAVEEFAAAREPNPPSRVQRTPGLRRQASLRSSRECIRRLAGVRLRPRPRARSAGAAGT
jgi:hypothetical protein